MEKAAAESSIEEELWEIFAYFNLRANPLEPELMGLNAFRSFCKLFSNHGLEQVQVAFATESSLRKKGGKTLDFLSFLNALMRLAASRATKTISKEEGFQKLVTSAVENYGKDHEFKRKKNDIVFNKSEIVELESHFEASLKQLIVPYCKMGLMYFQGFTKFCQDFGLLKPACLSLQELGMIFLALSSGIGVMVAEFGQFWKMVVMIALTAFVKTKVSDEDKVKGILLYLWREIKSTSSESQSSKGLHTLTYKSKFTTFWHAESYRDFLAPPEEHAVPPLSLLKKMPSPIKDHASRNVPSSSLDSTVDIVETTENKVGETEDVD